MTLPVPGPDMISKKNFIPPLTLKVDIYIEKVKLRADFSVFPVIMPIQLSNRPG